MKDELFMLSGPNSVAYNADHIGRLVARPQRPTALLTARHRSESPAASSQSQPPASGDQKLDLDSLQQELESKSGILLFESERIVAQMSDFINEGLLGSGSCSSVYQMRHATRSDLVMAVKQMRRSSTCEEENKRILIDLNVVSKSTDCPFIVQCFGIFFTTSDVWICMEVMLTSLDKLLNDLQRPFPERILGKITVSITTALDYLRKKHNMMHRDVKPSNMLLSFNGVIKLCDFGISGLLKDSIARSKQMGCVGYMAPERLETPKYDVRADIWSLGISLLELATGSFPYKGVELEFAIMSKIISEPAPSLPEHLPFTPEFRYFVDLCLKKDYQQRPKYRPLMKTEFFQRHNKPPFDVSDWLKGRPLAYLRQTDCTIQAQSPVLSSPNSSVTLSPDMSHKLRDLSLDESFELESQPSDTAIPKCKDASHFADSSGFYPPVSSVRGAIATTSVASRGLQLRESISMASSGYGSEEVPSSCTSGSRPPIAVHSALRGTAKRPDTLACSRLRQPKSKLLDVRKGEQHKINKLEQWVASSASYTTKLLTGNDKASNDAPPESVKKYLAKSSVGSNNHYVISPLLADSCQRSYTPPTANTYQIVRPELDPSPKPTPPRSASVGPYLQRCPAQRWLTKPAFVSNEIQNGMTIRRPIILNPENNKAHPNTAPVPPPVPPHLKRLRPLFTKDHRVCANRQHESPEPSAMLRLAQRLPTHPIPRRLDNNLMQRKIPNPVASKRSVKPPKPVTRSTSQPALLRNINLEWQSHETDL